MATALDEQEQGEANVRIFQALWLALKDAFEELLLMIISNVLWLVISAPLLVLTLTALSNGFYLLGLLLALLEIVPLGPATAGLFSVAQRITEGRASTWRDFISGMRRYAVQSWKVMGIWMVVLIIILVDIAFYSGIGNFFGGLMMVFWTYLLFVWIATLIYLFPLLLLQEQFQLRLLGRNVFLMTMGRPVFTLCTFVLMVLIAGLSSIIILLPLLFTIALLAQWSFRATLELIKESEERRAALENQVSEKESQVQELHEKGRRGQIRSK